MLFYRSMRFLDIPEYIFNYELGEVVFTFYNRYPNSFANHVISEDVLSREITEHKIITKKLIVKEGSSFTKKVPKWVSRLTKVEYMPTLEVSEFDRSAGTLVTYTRNVSWTRTMLMAEKCLYRKMDDSRTAVDRKLSVQANCSLLSGTVEKLLMKVFFKSTGKTLDGYQEKLVEWFGQRNANGGGVHIGIPGMASNNKKGLEMTKGKGRWKVESA